MTKDFDPYHKWLGIPPRDQPPNCYRLLGIEVFESDRDVIDAAANRLMGYLKDLAIGDDAAHSQKLLNEVAQARLSLLNDTKKQAYDEQLRDVACSTAIRFPPARTAACFPGRCRQRRCGSVPATRKVKSSKEESEDTVDSVRKVASTEARPWVILGSILAATLLTVGLLYYAMVGPSGENAPDPVRIRRRSELTNELTPPDEVDEPDSFRDRGNGRPFFDRRRGGFADDRKIGGGYPPNRRRPTNPFNDPFMVVPFEQTGPGPEPPEEPADDVSMNPGPAEPRPDVPPPNRRPVPDRPAFADFPEIVPLPATDSLSAVSVGPIHIASGTDCELDLWGGDKACRGTASFALARESATETSATWMIRLRKSRSSPETEIARLAWHRESQFEFQWLPNSDEDPLAKNLQNCALYLSARGDTHTLLLRAAEHPAGMLAELAKPVIKQTWRLEAIPNPSDVRFELGIPEGTSAEIHPEPVVHGSEGELWIHILDGGGQLWLKVTIDLNRALVLTVVPHLQLAEDEQREKLVLSQLKDKLNSLVIGRSQLPRQIQQLQTARQQARSGARQQMAQQIQFLENQQPKMTAAINDLQRLGVYLKSVESKFRFGFRIVHSLGPTEIELLSTKDFQPH